MGPLSVWPCRSLCGITYLSSFLSIYFCTWNRWCIMANTLKMLTSSLSNVHVNSWIYGLVPRADYKLWDMLFLFWSGFCMAGSWARRLSLYLACKPLPGLCACTRNGRWCASVVAVRSLSLFTNRADRRSQISNLDSWYATRVSKTTGVGHSYALLVTLMTMSWCLMSSDVIWHIRDKLWPMPKHGWIILYVHGNQKAR